MPTAIGGAVASCGTYLLTFAWPEAWGGPLRSALATTVIGCLFAGVAFGAPTSRWVVRGLLTGLAAGCTGLSLLVLPGVMETTAWRGVWYLAVTAVAAVLATTAGAVLGALFPGSHYRSPGQDPQRSRVAQPRRSPVGEPPAAQASRSPVVHHPLPTVTPVPAGPARRRPAPSPSRVRPPAHPTTHLAGPDSEADTTPLRQLRPVSHRRGSR